jgi:membrane protein YdbS with pleckstrin-like domain
LRDIFEDTQKLLRQEFALAKVEVREDARRAREVVMYLAAAAASLTISALLACISLAHLLTFYIEGFSLWLAFGCVALVSAVVGLFLARAARRRGREIRIFPEQTIESLKEGAEWIQGQASM